MKTLILLIFFSFTTARAEYIQGKILQVVPGGLLVQVTPPQESIRDKLQETKIIFVVNYPHEKAVVDGDPINWTAELDGRYQYTAVSGGTKTIEKYKCLSRETMLAIEDQKQKFAQESIRDQEAVKYAARNAEIARLKAMVPRVLAYQQQQASNGFPSFQLELGKRYLHGDGVETNLALARHWLTAACTNRESEASNLLSRLPKK